MAVIFFPQVVYKGQAITNTERATLGLMGSCAELYFM